MSKRKYELVWITLVSSIEQIVTTKYPKKFQLIWSYKNITIMRVDGIMFEKVLR